MLADNFTDNLVVYNIFFSEFQHITGCMCLNGIRNVWLVLHGITSHAFNYFGWGWGGVKNVQFWKFFFCDIYFEFVVFWGLFWWIHSDINRYIHIHIHIHIHLFWNVAIWKKYIEYIYLLFSHQEVFLFLCLQ